MKCHKCNILGAKFYYDQKHYCFNCWMNVIDKAMDLIKLLSK